MKKAGRYGILCLLLLLSQSCHKNKATIPNVLVDITANINNPGYIDLTIVGGHHYFDGGSRGIIAYRRSTEEFVAYDRHCPYKAEDGAVLSVQSDNVTMKCPSCSSVFSIYDGTLQSGPASNPLKTYNTSFDGTNLRIYN